MERGIRKVLQDMASSWPSEIVSRCEIGAFTGGALKERYCANLDSAGKGIQGRFRIGRKVCYPVNSVIDFLEKRSEKIESKEV